MRSTSYVDSVLSYRQTSKPSFSSNENSSFAKETYNGTEILLDGLHLRRKNSTLLPLLSSISLSRSENYYDHMESTGKDSDSKDTSPVTRIDTELDKYYVRYLTTSRVERESVTHSSFRLEKILSLPPLYSCITRRHTWSPRFDSNFRVEKTGFQGH